MIFLYRQNNVDELSYRNLLDNLPNWRKEQNDKMIFEEGKLNNAVAFYLLRIALQREFNIKQRVSFVYGMYGKPYIHEYPDIHFSISHCKEAVACATDKRNIGIDVQEFMDGIPSLYKKVLSNKEYKSLQINDRDVRFIQYWTLKEAYLKNLGMGISERLSMDELDFSDTKKEKFLKYGKYFTSYKFSRMFLSVCADGNFFEKENVVNIEIEEINKMAQWVRKE
nr:4'-phosphopantetheinyl transferase superfamily protein [uncultured Blautia sp.]